MWIFDRLIAGPKKGSVSCILEKYKKIKNFRLGLKAMVTISSMFLQTKKKLAAQHDK